MPTKRHIFAAAIVACSLSCGIKASAQSYTDPYKGYSEETFMDMDFEPNLATPVVGAKEKPAIRKNKNHIRICTRRIRNKKNENIRKM